jgi:hypothetical protein
LTWPEDVRAVPFEEAYVLDYGAGERVAARWDQGGLGKTLLVHEKGPDAAVESEDATKARTRGDSLLMIDVFAGRGPLPLLRQHSDYLSFHRSDDANRIQDVMTALAFLARGDGKVTLACPGRAALWCAVAVAAAPASLQVELEPELWERAVAQPVRIAGFSSAGGLTAVAQRR